MKEGTRCDMCRVSVLLHLTFLAVVAANTDEPHNDDAGVCYLFPSLQSGGDESRVRLVGSGGSLIESCQCTLQHNDDVYWTLEGTRISSTVANITFTNSSPSQSPSRSHLILNNITKNMAGRLCCHQGLLTPACITVVVDQFPSPVISIELLPTSESLTASPADGQTATIVCGLFGYGNRYVESGFMMLYVNDKGSMAYDSNPDIQRKLQSGESTWKMKFHMHEHIHEGDKLQCTWWTSDASKGKFVSNEITARFESQSFGSDLSVAATSEAQRFSHRPSTHVHVQSTSEMYTKHGGTEDDASSSKTQHNELSSSETTTIIIVVGVIVVMLTPFLVWFAVKRVKIMKRSYHITDTNGSATPNDQELAFDTNGGSSFAEPSFVDLQSDDPGHTENGHIAPVLYFQSMSAVPEQFRRQPFLRSKMDRLLELLQQWPVGIEDVNEFTHKNQILEMSLHLGYSWWMIGLGLGLEVATLENIEYRHQSDQKAQGHTMMVE